MNKFYFVKRTDLFNKKFDKLIPDNKKEDVNRRINKLSENPYVGKPLSYNFLRELKLDKFRIYYYIYEQKVMVLMVNISDKKDQKKVILNLKNEQSSFMEYIRKI